MSTKSIKKSFLEDQVYKMVSANHVKPKMKFIIFFILIGYSSKISEMKCKFAFNLANERKSKISNCEWPARKICDTMQSYLQL